MHLLKFKNSSVVGKTNWTKFAWIRPFLKHLILQLPNTLVLCNWQAYPKKYPIIDSWLLFSTFLELAGPVPQCTISEGSLENDPSMLVLFPSFSSFIHFIIFYRNYFLIDSITYRSHTLSYSMLPFQLFSVKTNPPRLSQIVCSHDAILWRLHCFICLSCQSNVWGHRSAHTLVHILQAVHVAIHIWG